ncbi:MAG: glucose 1-dehydrogenase [Candidatus Latescibacteria bacterium]|jgi:NAD(P)-dependent dehydrogenase (short-subunit alcohol dehydrogenase family)|nr:glucose 1-dehydrogenase [Candidatus Latescibacterota bacterium]
MKTNKFALTDRVALVTGAGQGLGEAIALGMAEAGARVVLAGRKAATLESVAERIGALGGEHLVVPTDVANKDTHANLVEKTMNRWGRIDILVNNAGTNVRMPTEDYREEDWDTVLDTNLKGTFFLTQSVAREMIRQSYGKIVHIASLASITGLPNIAAYTAAKGGIGALTYQMAVEWAKHHINVNAICPGYIRTPLTKPIQESERGDFIEGRVPMGRWGEPEDIAGTAVFLAGSASDYLTGQLIAVDGGWMAGG